MQNPVGAEFNPQTMRMEMTDFFAVLFNEVAQAKFVHTVSAGYVTASVFVIGVSAWYLLKGRHTEMARRSITVGAAFGLASAFSVVILGDESGYSATHSQKMKLAAIEAMWETHEPPAPFNLTGFPDQEARETHFAIEVPWAMGMIGTRSLTTEIPGINDLVAQAEDRIRSGLIAYDALMHIREARDAADPAIMAAFEQHSDDLGFAFLLKKYVDDPRTATEEQIVAASNDTVPQVWPLFWAFRIMVGLGFGFIATMAYFFWRASFRQMDYPRWALRLAVVMIPTPWIAAEMGWFVAEFGRQPWTVDGILPTAMSVSALSITEVGLTLAGFVTFYTILFIIEMGLMRKYILKGPFQDVAETEAWVQRHTDRLSGRRNADAIATPAE
jgi:cytochrome d ubiquinol oxidase subunit I